ncbi:phospholipase A1-Igamma1, chloroplastic [Euphorbia lathyris]|uniref:phospholipase A1-Igamma1, chloroplastic n=1 Tax=Euphorbia lathyris TaxID=212925 RepID=UPI0033139992
MEMSPYRPVTATPRFRKATKVLKKKLQTRWQAIRKKCRLLFRRTSRLSTIKIHHQQLQNNSKNGCQPHRTLGHLLLPRTASSFIDQGDKMTPTFSLKEDISSMWQQIHGSTNWDTLLDPLHPWVRQEILKYGEFVQATYDAFDFDPLSEYCGSCRYNKMKLFDELGLTRHGYEVKRYIYAMSHVDVPEWLAKSYDSWSKDSNWMGYVAVSNNEESKRIGRRDIVVAWRGTVAPTEWYNDLRTKLELVDDNGDEDDQNDIKVQQGFLSIYKSKGEFTRYNKSSASEQVMQEVKKLVKIYTENGEEVSLTITGHSLGGALALLNAYEAATSIPGLFISVISFGAPRVGNLSFRKKLNELRINTLRVVIKQDIVPKVPGIILNNILNKVSRMTSRLNWVYRHVGTKLKLDISTSPYLRKDADVSGCHNLEVYLHLVDGYLGKKMNFRWNARRDLALVNKGSNMLVEKLRIPECWYEMPHKGLVLNKYGRWVKPSRQPEDVPSPSTSQLSSHN